MRAPQTDVFNRDRDFHEQDFERRSERHLTRAALTQFRGRIRSPPR